MFAVIVVQEADLPHANTILLTTYATVGLSVLAHGVTAAPLARRYAAWFASHPDRRRRRWRAFPPTRTGGGKPARSKLPPWTWTPSSCASSAA